MMSFWRSWSRKTDRPSAILEGKKYVAFISYSQHDRKAALWLHRELEGYRIPRGLDLPDAQTLPRCFAPVFIDREELPASADIGATIRNALLDSTALIVVCSPNSAASMWVEAEVEFFKQNAGSGKIFCVLLDEDRSAVSTSLDQLRDVLPRPLRSSMAEGVLGDGAPLAVDLKRDGRKESIRKLVAGIIGVPYELLSRRHLLRQRRLWLIWCLIVLAMAAALTQGVKSISAARMAARSQESERIAELSIRVTESGDFIAGALLALRALPETKVDAVGPWPAKAEQALRLAMSNWSDVKVIGLGDQKITKLTFGAQTDSIAIGTADGAVLHWDLGLVAAPIIFRLPGEIANLAYSKGRNYLVATTRGSALSVWDMDKKKEILKLDNVEYADSGYYQAELNETGTRLLTHAADIGRTLLVYDVSTGARLREIADKDGAFPICAYFVGPGSNIVSVWAGGDIRTIDVNGQMRSEGKIDFEVHGCVINSSRDTLAVLGFNGVVQLIDLRTRSLKRKLVGHGLNQRVVSGTFTADGSRLITGGDDRTVRVWSLKDGRQLGLFEHDDPVVRIEVDDTSQNILTLTRKGTRHLWSMSGGQGRRIAGNGSAVSMDKRRSQIAVAQDSGRVFVQDTSRGSLLFTLPGHTNGIRVLRFDARGEQLISGSDDGDARIWRLGSIPPASLRLRNDEWVLDAAFSLDGSRAVTCTTRGKARVWDARTGTRLATLQVSRRNNIDTCFFNTTGQYIFAQSGNAIELWEVASKTCVGAFVRSGDFEKSTAIRPCSGEAEDSTPDLGLLNPDRVSATAVSKDGKTLVAGWENGAILAWDIGSRLQKFNLVGHSKTVLHMAFNDDGRRVASAGLEGKVVISDMTTGVTIRVLSLPDSPRFVAFHPTNPDLIAVIYDYHLPAMFSISTGKRVQEFFDEKQSFSRLAFSPNGETLLGYYSEFTENTFAITWNTATGKRAAYFDHARPVKDATISPDGRRFVTSDDGGAIRVWGTLDDEPDKLIEMARRKLGGIALTTKELATFGIGPRP